MTGNRHPVPHRPRVPVWLLAAALACGLLLGGCASRPASQPEDLTEDRVVQRILRDNECLKCHGVKRKKTGPAWSEVAEKYRDRADAEDRLVRHLTTAPIIDLDGNPETHKVIKSMSEAQIRGLSRWLLSL